MQQTIEWALKEQSSKIGGGIIVFVQSYAVQSKFKQSFTAQSSFVYWEEQGSIDVFTEYSAQIKKGKPAVLICVIGGKLSEGINFSDNLARTVFVFGLPFPSTQSQALREKMVFYDQLAKQSSSSFDGKQFYENLTMRVLN